MDNLLIVIMVLGMMIMGILFMGIPVAAWVFIWMNVYPQARKLGKWAARLENLISLAIVAGLLFALIIAGLILPLPTITQILFILLIPILLILFVPIDLGLLVWLIRFVKWLYARLKIWLIVAYLRYRVRTGPRRPPREPRKSTGTK